MRILMLTDSFLPHAGGSREYYYNVYRCLAEFEGTRVTIATKKFRAGKSLIEERHLIPSESFDGLSPFPLGDCTSCPRDLARSCMPHGTCTKKPRRFSTRVTCIRRE